METMKDKAAKKGRVQTYACLCRYLQPEMFKDRIVAKIEMDFFVTGTQRAIGLQQIFPE